MGLVPGKNFSFSDHEGVSAAFVMKDSGIDRTGRKHTLLEEIFATSNFCVLLI